MAVWPLCLSFFLLFALDASEAAPLNGTCNGTMGANCTEAPQNPAMTLVKIDRECVSTCDSGWSAYNCRCFRFFNLQRSWTDAEKMCLGYDGNLASIHTHEEYAFIQKLITSQIQTSAEAWIGGYDIDSQLIWFWSDGSKMNLEMWAPGQPDQTKENCIGINYGDSGNWNNFQCHLQRAFVCVKK
ncbi:hypothetical protein Q8A67_000210 [Cirrhinus molitorella]|uniref:C-type lectin domain-containing protein n=1 Tax=Cirrhinus molitorella TaxID=172907 RepID=A0AA88U6I6_9TELE|nr:hypothetical protein Q8A67_000210 [Cirrhinus molitorella]